jgi:putative SOS response-associated peptidase YedK
MGCGGKVMAKQGGACRLTLYDVAMCYSAQVIDAYDEYCDVFGADIEIETFAALYGMKLYDNRVKTPRSLDDALARDARADLQRVREVALKVRAKEIALLGQEVVEQRERLAKAEAALATKVTKKASDEKRIATNKIGRALEKLEDLQRTDLQASDARMFPGYYVPVMVVENGKKIVRPMRYHLRPAGKPEGFDREFPGTYNARLDKMDTFWRKQFGYTHGIAIVTAFYEHVVNASGERAILEFKPDTGQHMYVACLWSHWTAPGKEDLYSFAFITDEPPPEVLAAGHDRCIIPLKRDDVDAWLNPDPKDLDSLYDILAARERPYYVHKVAG